MAWPKLLVLVRHAESEGNVLNSEERTKLDISTHAYCLTERGRKQAKITGQYLQKEFGTFDVYYVSYYARSKETMKIMYPFARVYEDPRLAEAQRGIWHTMTEKQVRERFPEELERQRREGWYHYRPLGGENWPDVELRIHSFLGTLNRDYENKRVLMVVHGNWMVLFKRLINHFSIEETVEMYQKSDILNASVTIYKGKEKNGKSRLLMDKYIIPWLDKI